MRRSGFETGYFARYLNSDPPRWRYIDSGAYVFRQAQGARAFMRWMLDSGFAQSGRRTRVALGDEAWLYSRPSENGTALVWRHHRVTAWVSCREMTGHRSLALAQARKQQRRMVAALG